MEDTQVSVRENKRIPERETKGKPKGNQMETKWEPLARHKNKTSETEGKATGSHEYLTISPQVDPFPSIVGNQPVVPLASVPLPRGHGRERTLLFLVVGFKGESWSPPGSPSSHVSSHFTH